MDSFVISVLTPTIRHAMTALGGYLVASGLLEKTQAANFTVIATGLVIGAAGLAWSYIKNARAAAK